jgi:UDP-N-acetylmuramyl tripeptide synthase
LIHEPPGPGGHPFRGTGYRLRDRPSQGRPRHIFGAFPGTRFNGEDFISDAVSAGAVAVVARGEAEVSGVPHLAAAEPRREFARLAAKFFQPFPGTVVAVTAPTARHPTSSSPGSCGAWRGTMPPRSAPWA